VRGIGIVPAVGNFVWFGIYLTGFVVVIAGLIYGASLMHVPTHWIVVAGPVLVEIGILTGVTATRQKDSAI
jgi:cadmium resistance protein CadD (predicted permease)